MPMKIQFKLQPLPNFGLAWLLTYSLLSKKAAKMLMFFEITYLCETALIVYIFVKSFAKNWQFVPSRTSTFLVLNAITQYKYWVRFSLNILDQFYFYQYGFHEISFSFISGSTRLHFYLYGSPREIERVLTPQKIKNHWYT